MRTEYLLAGLLILGVIRTADAASPRTLTHYQQDIPSHYRVTNATIGNYPMSLQSPHVNWAKPFAKGKLKVLAILPVTAAREAKELQERMSMKLSLLPVISSTQFAAGHTAYSYRQYTRQSLLQRAEDLLGGVGRYDVILVGKVQWSILPDSLRQQILQDTRQGTGLVLVTPYKADQVTSRVHWDKVHALMDQIKNTIPLKLLPTGKRDVSQYTDLPPRRIGPLSITTGMLGAGRVVYVKYHDTKGSCFGKAGAMRGWTYVWRKQIGLTPWVAYNPLQYEYDYSVLAKVMLFAARKDTDCRIIPSKTVAKVARSSLPDNAVRFHVVGTHGYDASLVCEWQLRDKRGRVLDQGNATLKHYDGRLLASPMIPPLAEGRYVIDAWIMRNGRILNWASSMLLVKGTEYIDRIVSDKRYYRRGHTIKVSVVYHHALNSGQKVYFNLYDTWGRLVERAIAEKPRKHYRFAPVNHPHSRIYRIVVGITDSRGVVQRKSIWVGVPESGAHGFQFLIWGSDRDTCVSQVAMHQCKMYGVTGYYDTTSTWSPTSVVKISARRLAENNFIALPYCFGVWNFAITKHQTMQDWLKRYQHKIYPPRVKAYRPFGTMAYSICEENTISHHDGIWDNQTARRDYQHWLRNRYHTLRNLNSAWGTSFRSFNQVKQISITQAQKTGQYGRWADQITYRQDRFTSLHHDIARTIRSLAPGAHVDVTCIKGMDYDWPRMSTFVNCYSKAPPLDGFHRSFNRYAGDVFGYYWNNLGKYTMRIRPWLCLFRGGNHMLWWPSPSVGAFTPTLSEPYRAFREASKSVNAIQKGIGKLLLSSRRPINSIDILWSDRSYEAGLIHPLPISWTDSRRQFETMLRHMGFAFRTIDPEELQQITYGKKHQVLILPECQAISDKTARLITVFVKNGGLAIADYLPGTMDQTLHGRGRSATPKSNLSNIFEVNGSHVRKIGKGYTLCFNDPVPSRSHWPGLRRIIERYGHIRTFCDVMDKYHDSRTDAQRYIYQDGPAMFVGIIADRKFAKYPGPQTVVTTYEKYNVYDMIAKTFLGKTDHTRIWLDGLRPRLLAFLPEKIQGIRVSISKHKYQRGGIIKLKGCLYPESLNKMKDVVHVIIKHRDKVMRFDTSNISFNGTFTKTIPIALNAKYGQYHITVREVISGYEAGASYTIVPKP